MRLLFPILVTCSALFAQDQAALNRFAPKDSCLVVHFASPAKWKDQFAKTQIIKLLQAKSLAPWIDKASKEIDSGIAELRTSGAFDADLVEKLLSDYTGDMTLSLQVDWADVESAMEEDRPPAISGSIAMTPDGKFDLAALATNIEKVFERPGQQPLRDLKAGDHRLRFVADSDIHVSVPTMVDGQLVWLFGKDLEKSASTLLASDARFDGGAAGQSMFLHADLAALVAAIGKAVGKQAEDSGAPFDFAQIWKDFGLAALGALQIQLGANDKQVVSETHLSMTNSDTGLFGLFLLDQGTPKLLRYVPTNAESFSVNAFDVNALYRTISKIWTSLGDAVPMSLEDAEAAFTEATKVRLKEDLLDHIGTEMLNLADVEAAIQAAAEEPEDPMAMLGGQCLCLSLRNGAAFGESLEKALRARGLHAGRKTEEYQGTKVHQLRIAGTVDLEYAVLDDMLLLAIGKQEGVRRNLRAILDTHAAAATGGDLAEGVQKKLKSMPAGWSGAAVTPVASLLSGIDGALSAMQTMGDMPDELQQMLEVLSGVASDMKRLGLETMVSTSHTTAKSLLTRMRW